jgi:hypothetical protein
VGAGMLVSGCVSVPKLPPVFENLVSAASTTVWGRPDAPVTPQYVANLPYASMLAKIGKGQRSLLVLGRYDGPDLHWISADQVAVVTRNGRLVQTAGLDRNLRSTTQLDDDPIATGSFVFGTTFSRTVDLGPDGPYGVLVDSSLEIVKRETVLILDREHDALVIRERNTAHGVRWSFKNTYWADFKTGFVWASVQHFSPREDPMQIQITKPAGPPALG